MSNDWQYGLFGCYGNRGLCILSFLVPCYRFGKNAEEVGDSCCLCGVCSLIPIARIVAGTSLRGKVREKRDIGGSVWGDFLTVFLCHFCAMVQEARELEDVEPEEAFAQRE